MGEILTIRLSSELNEPIPWLLWSPIQQGVVSSGEVETVSQLSGYAKEREVILLVDSSSITLTSVAIPAGSERQLDAVLPFLLEDELAQDVMQVHVALLKKEKELAHVAVVEHKQMQFWLGALAEVGIFPRHLIPDCLCLPLQAPDFSAALLYDKWLLRSSETTGGAAEEAWLPVWLDSLGFGQPKAQMVQTPLENQENLESQEDKENSDVPRVKETPVDNVPVQVISFSGLPQSHNENWQLEQVDSLFSVLAQGAITSPFNLLVGRYKPQSQLSKHLKPWRGAAFAGVLLMLVWGGESIFSIYQTEKQVELYKAQITEQVTAMFPDNRRIPTTSFMKRLFEEDIKRLSGASTKEGYLPWLAEVAPLIKEVSTIKLDAIRFDRERGEMRLNMRGSDFADFEKLREMFSRKYKTELGQLKRDAAVVTGAFVLMRKS